MISVVVVDDHYAVRLGLRVALDSEPDITCEGAAGTAAELTPLLYRSDPDVVVVDYRLPDVDGLTLCRRIKDRAHAPGVVLHSAFADDSLTVPAILAGADAIVHKGAPGRELAAAVRAVAAGATSLPPVDPDVLRTRAEVLHPDDHAILGMLINGTPAGEVAEVLRLHPKELRARRDRMLAALRTPTTVG